MSIVLPDRSSLSKKFRAPFPIGNHGDLRASPRHRPMLGLHQTKTSSYPLCACKKQVKYGLCSNLRKNRAGQCFVFKARGSSDWRLASAMASDPKISLTPRMKSLSFQDGTVTQNSYSGSSFSSEAASSCDCFVTSFPHFRKALKQV